MPFKPGQSGNPKGRKAGEPNRTTKALKDAIMGAFDAKGGQAYLERIADADPRTFCTLLGKVLPTEIKGEMDLTFQSLADSIQRARERASQA